jgi:hypothetical protein
LNGSEDEKELNVPFSIKECTRRQKDKTTGEKKENKQYSYVGQRITLDKSLPVYILHEDKFNFENVKEEHPFKNVEISYKVGTTYSGRELQTKNGETYFVSDDGKLFKNKNKHKTGKKRNPVYVPYKKEFNYNTVTEETKLTDVVIKDKKVSSVFNGKQVKTNRGAVYLVSDTGLVFKQITYLFKNDIKKMPKTKSETVQQEVKQQ